MDLNLVWIGVHILFAVAALVLFVRRYWFWGWLAFQVGVTFPVMELLFSWSVIPDLENFLAVGLIFLVGSMAVAALLEQRFPVRRDARFIKT